MKWDQGATAKGQDLFDANKSESQVIDQIEQLNGDANEAGRHRQQNLSTVVMIDF